MTVVDITSKAQFNELIEKNPVVVIQAHATWCGPCKAISPIFNKQADAHQANDKIVFTRFDTDDVPDLSFELGIRSIPAFFVFENGDKAENVTGANPPALIKLIGTYADKASAAGGAAPAAEGALKTDENF